MLFKRIGKSVLVVVKATGDGEENYLTSTYHVGPKTSIA